MPGNQGPGEERILLARQSAEAMLDFLARLEKGEVDMHEAKAQIGLFAFSEDERAPLLEVLQRAIGFEHREVIVEEDENGKLFPRIVVGPPRRRDARA